MVAAGAQAAAGARAAARPAFARPRADDTFGRFGLSRRRAVPILRAPRAVAGGVSRPARGESSPRAPRDVRDDAALESLLANVRVALRVSGPAETHASAMIWGDGENLGMPTRWCLRHDGARFLEEALGSELSYVSGCDHRDESMDESMDGSEPALSPADLTHVTAWETDFTGYTQRLALDDREAALLSGWTRCHFWAKPEARSFLRLELLSSEDVEDGSEGDKRLADDAFYVAASLRDGLLRAVIAIDKETHLPARMTARVCGDEERWTFAEWAPLSDFASNGSSGSSGSSVLKRRDTGDACESGAMVPGLTVLEGSAGGKQTFRVTGARRNSGVTEKRKETFYRAPRRSAETKPLTQKKTATDKASNETGDASRVRASPRNAGGVSFVEGVAPEVVIERARSSHVLVRPLIDGIDVGPFILDTGASGLVITKAAAEKLAACASFGEVFVSGVSGKVPCRFRRASELRLGPLLVDRPVFMEMALGGIVSGAADPVAGIVGFDAFKSAVVEVGPGGAPVRIYDPSTFKAHEKWAWHEIALVSNVPHAYATFSTVARDTTLDTTLDDDDDASPVTTTVNDDDTRGDTNEKSRSRSSVSGVFMIDSGAGGADAIFHKRAVETLGLRSILPPPPAGGARGTSRVRGVGGSDGESSGATRAYRGELEWLELTVSNSEQQTAANGSSARRDEDVRTCPETVSPFGRKNEENEESLHLGSGGRFEKLDVLLAADAGFDLSEHSVGLICANALNTRRVVYDVPNRRVALLVDGVDVSPCESLLCAGPLDWERAPSREGVAADGTALPTPTAEELELFGESLRFGQNE